MNYFTIENSQQFCHGKIKGQLSCENLLSITIFFIFLCNNCLTVYSTREVTGVVAFVQESRANIEGKFAKLLTNVYSKLMKKRIKVGKVRIFITARFPLEDFQYKLSKFDAVFQAITRKQLWNYWHYSLLEQFVEQFGGKDREMKSWIESYRKDLANYKASVKVVDYIASHEVIGGDSSDKKQPTKYDEPYLTKLSMKLKTKFDNHTLEFIGDFWRKFADFHDMPSLGVTLDQIRSGCVAVVWCIPSHLAPKIVDTTPDVVEFYSQHEITRLEVDGRCIYQEECTEVCICLYLSYLKETLSAV